MEAALAAIHAGAIATVVLRQEWFRNVESEIVCVCGGGAHRPAQECISVATQPVQSAAYCSTTLLVFQALPPPSQSHVCHPKGMSLIGLQGQHHAGCYIRLWLVSSCCYVYLTCLSAVYLMLYLAISYVYLL